MTAGEMARLTRRYTEATRANSTRWRMGSMRSARTRTLSPRYHSSWRDFAPRPEAEAPALALLTRREGDAPPARTGGARPGPTDEEAEPERREPRAPRPLPGPRLPPLANATMA